MGLGFTLRPEATARKTLDKTALKTHKHLEGRGQFDTLITYVEKDPFIKISLHLHP